MNHTKRKSASGKTAKAVETKELAKIHSGTRGLDDILSGGLPLGRSTLVSGGPGTGKSIVGLQFLAEGARAGEPGIFVTFEERAAAVRKNALTLGLDLDEFERKNLLFVLDARPDASMIVSGDFDISGLLAIISGKAAQMGAKRIVIDAIDILISLYDNPARERKELYALHQWIMDHSFTSIITMKTETVAVARYAFLEFMMDCVIQMDQRQLDQIVTRRIRIVKYRGSGFNGNEHPFVIMDGVRIIPLSSIELRYLPMGERISSGEGRFDKMLYGGYHAGACVLMTGASGTGKTTFSGTFARAASRRREKTLYVSFEESSESITANMLSPGIDIRPGIRSGHLRFITAMPESCSAETHLARIYDTLDDFQPGHVIVDAISACTRMGTAQTANEFIVRLFNACKERGITLFLINQAKGMDDNAEDISGMGISSLVDTVILLSHRQNGSAMRRSIRVLKERGSNHDSSEREFAITDKGIVIDGAAGDRERGGGK